MVQLPYTFTKRIKEQNADIKQLILDALDQSGHDLSEASRLLGIKRQSLQYHMDKNGISIKRCTKIQIDGERVS